MTKKARVVIELEEHFTDDVPNDTVADHAETIWEERLRLMDLDGRISEINVYKIDE